MNIVRIIINYPTYSDTNTIIFNDLGRIDYIKTPLQECYITYNNEYIENKAIYQVGYRPCGRDTAAIFRYYYNQKLLTHFYIECAGNQSCKDTFYYKYENTDLFRSIYLYNNKNELVRTDILISDDSNNFFQWEVIIKDRVYIKYLRDRNKRISDFPRNNKYKLLNIKNITYSNPKGKVAKGSFRDKYSLLDMSGNVIGTINVERMDR